MNDQDRIDSQDHLPAHKRDGYAEHMREMSDMRRKEIKENFDYTDYTMRQGELGNPDRNR